MIETDAFAALNALAPAGGVWANTAPDEPTAPYIVYSRISSVPELDLAGSVLLTRVRLQIDCYATTYEEVKALAESVRSAMAGAAFKCVVDSDQDTFDYDVKLHRVITDFLCWQ